MTLVTEPEVIVVGKGFSGLALSFLLQQSGVPHLVLARREKERRVALGETLPPSALGLLQSMGLRDLFEACALQKTHGYHSVWGSPQRTDRHFFSLHPFQNGLKLDRTMVLNALEELVQEQILPYEGLLEIQEKETCMQVKISEKGKTKQFQTPLLVDATGRKRSLLKQLGIASIDLDHLIAFSCHVEVPKPPSLIHGVVSESFPDGWGIASRLSNNRYALSVFVRPGSPAAQSLRNYSNWVPALQKTRFLKDFLVQEPLTPVVGATANSSCAESFAGPNWLAVGDAAMAFDPLSSHGISNALYGADQAHKAILKSKDSSPAPFLKYKQNLTGIFNAYLKEKDALYAREKRWPGTVFWG